LKIIKEARWQQRASFSFAFQNFHLQLYGSVLFPKFAKRIIHKGEPI